MLFDVISRAGSTEPEAIRKAALATEILLHLLQPRLFPLEPSVGRASVGGSLKHQRVIVGLLLPAAALFVGAPRAAAALIANFSEIASADAGFGELLDLLRRLGRYAVWRTRGLPRFDVGVHWYRRSSRPHAEAEQVHKRQ